MLGFGQGPLETATTSDPTTSIPSKSSLEFLQGPRRDVRQRRQAAVAPFGGLGFEDRALPEEGAEGVGQVEQVVGRDVRLELERCEFQRLGKPEQADTRGAFGGVTQSGSSDVGDAPLRGDVPLCGKCYLDPGVRILEVSPWCSSSWPASIFSSRTHSRSASSARGRHI